MLVLWVGTLASLAVLGRAFNTTELINEDHAGNTSYRLPQLYALDDYDRCLARPGALYCVGTFRLRAARPLDRYHRALQEHSAEPRHFDRTLLHRGYCVSARCPGLAGAREQRFASCAREEEPAAGLQLRLLAARCSGAEDPQPVTERRDTVFAWAVAVLLLLNVLGTVYDVYGGDAKKNKVLMCWSLRCNWRSLRNTARPHTDPRAESLAPIEGYRVLVHALFVAGHIMGVMPQLFLRNPHHLERLYYESSSYLWRNGAAVLHGFVMLSSFLHTNSRISSSNRVAGLAQLPRAAARRMVRFAPVHLLVVGFAATWWRHAGDGPLWADVVGAESDVCRRKFLLHALFLHNLFDNDEHCLIQTWSFAVDVQLFVGGSLLLALLARTRRLLPALAGLFLFCSALKGVLAYLNEWESLVFIATPENLRRSFRGVASFGAFYQSPLNSLPAHLLGVLLALVHDDLRRRGVRLAQCQPFARCCQLSLPLMVWWLLGGEWFYERRAPLTTAVFAALECSVFLLLLGIYFIGVINNVDSMLRRVTAWRGWRPLGRLSLAMMSVHWCVLKTLLASRRTLAVFSAYNVTVDTLTTLFFSYCLALPLALLVEMPLMKTFSSALPD